MRRALGTNTTEREMSQRFVIRFDPDAVKEYDSLDGSVILLVDKAIATL